MRADVLLPVVVVTFVASVAAQVVLIGPGRLPAYVAAIAFHLWLLAAVWFVLESVRRLWPPLRWLVFPLALLVSGMVYGHAYFFDVAVERRLTLFDMTLSGIGYFFTSALPTAALAGLLLVWTLVITAPWLAARRRFDPGPRTLWGVAGALVLSFSLVVLPQRIPSPLFDTSLELWEVATLPKVESDVRPPSALVASLDKLAQTHAAEPLHFSKIIVLVMETMTAATLEAESAPLAQPTFFRAEHAHMHTFSRYYANNQDSRTGMLAMLFARLIPYEAYSDVGYGGYRGLAATPSLVDRMRSLSFRSAFAVSQRELEDVVGDLAWDERLHLDDATLAAAPASGKLCFTPDEWERSCEDLVLLPQVVEFVARHPRAFVYQEFIWGHAAEYNDASGKSNARYYSEYVDALRDALRSRGLLDDTLIVVTSDHGYRDKGRQTDPEVYRVPLLLHAERFSAQRDTRLLSHVELGMLLFEELTPSAPRAPSQDLVLAVGPTGQGHLFAVNAAGGTLLVREKFGQPLLVAQQGVWQLSPGAVRAGFEAYRTRFDRLLSQ
jgi:hypothetical protein